MVKAPGLHDLIDGLLIMPKECCPGVALALYNVSAPSKAAMYHRPLPCVILVSGGIETPQRIIQTHVATPPTVRPMSSGQDWTDGVSCFSPTCSVVKYFQHSRALAAPLAHRSLRPPPPFVATRVATSLWRLNWNIQRGLDHVPVPTRPPYVVAAFSWASLFALL